MAHGGNILIDEQYFFQSADDAWWFWHQGYEGRLYANDEGDPCPLTGWRFGLTTRKSIPAAIPP